MKKSLGCALAALGTMGLLGVGGFTAFFAWASAGPLDTAMYAAGAIEVSDRHTVGAAPETIRIVTYNVGYASGRSNNTGQNATEAEYGANLDRIVAALDAADPHIVAYQEIDYASARSYFVDQLTHVADALEHPFRARAYNWDKNYLPFPYWPPGEHFKRVQSGQAVSSVLPIRGHSKVTLMKPVERPFYYNAFYLDRIAQIVAVDVNGAPVTLINVHLEAYMVGTRQAQAEQVVEIVRQYDHGPLILLGDFNAEPPWVGDGGDGGEPDRTMDLIFEETGLRAAIPESAYEDGDHFTFSSWEPGVRIDHILYNEWIEGVDARVLADAGEGSDHLPVLMTFRVRDTGGV